MNLDIDNTHKVNIKSSHQICNSAKDENVIAVLGPTNTGKTHYAIERMLTYESGIIGCPLRLLARELYEKLVKIKGILKVALITGEESIIPKMAQFYVCTVEAMPKDLLVEFIAVDEIQLSSHQERGHIFTDRILNSRGSMETIFIGSYNLSYLLKVIIPSIKIKKMNRFSSLDYSGKFKISKMPRRSAIVTFSVNDVYEIAEFVKRRHGGTAVVLGALSPKTRNAQVDLYESGEVNHLVATDAIGMGLNMDINHVAFAKLKKFDGKISRNLRLSETAQIAGRAGRYKKNGSFGETANCPVFSERLVNAIENHNFPDVHSLLWRNSNLDFSSTSNLIKSLVTFSREPHLKLSPESDDERVLRHLIKKTDVKIRSVGFKETKELWNVCCIPDYQKNYDDSHYSLLEEIYCYLIDKGKIPEDWINSHLEYLDNMVGELDLLTIRLLNVRMWNYVSNRSSWIDKNSGVKEKAKSIEDKLSDALHMGLVDRFVGYKTSQMVKKLKDNEDLSVKIKNNEVFVEEHYVGRLDCLNFINEISKNYQDKKSLLKIIIKALCEEITRRVDALQSSSDENFSFNKEFDICWNSNIIATLTKGDSMYCPKIKLLNTEYLDDEQLLVIANRLRSYVNKRIANLRLPLSKILKIFPNGTASGLIYQLYESSGCVLSSDVKDLLNNMTLEEKQKLKEIGVRVGEICVWIPATVRYGRPQLGWFLSQKFHDISPLLPFQIKTKPISIEKIPRNVWNAGGFVIIKNYAYFVEFLEQLGFYIKKIMKNKKIFFMNKKNIKKIKGSFNISYHQLVSILKYLGYVRKSNDSPIYVLENIKKIDKYTRVSDRKLTLSPFHILRKNIR